MMLSGRDMDMSCDEAVPRHMDGDERADYAQCLLRCTAGKAHIAGMPLAFSEGDTGKRIRNLANWKKPVLWLCILAVALSVPLVFIRPASAAEPVEMVYGPWDGIRKEKFTMPEYPGVTFIIPDSTDTMLRYEEAGVEHTAVSLSSALFDWGYLENMYLVDLNGDGIREICITVNKGSGASQPYILVYNHTTKQCHVMHGFDRYEYYTLGMEDGQMVVWCLDAIGQGIKDSGKLLIIGERLIFIGKKSFNYGETFPEWF